MGNIFSSKETSPQKDLLRAICADDASTATQIVLTTPESIKLDGGLNAIHEAVVRERHEVLRALLSLIQHSSEDDSIKPSSPMRKEPSSPAKNPMKAAVSLSSVVRKAMDSRRGEAGMTPLMFAAEKGDLRAVKMLLLEGADPWRHDKSQKRTAVHFAATNGHVNVLGPIIEASHANLAPSKAVRKGGLFARFSQPAMTTDDRTATMTAPEAHTTPLVDLQTRSLFTPLMIAAVLDHAEVAERLLQLGASYRVPQGPDSLFPSYDPLLGNLPEGYSVLHCAARRGNYRTCRAILNCFAQSLTGAAWEAQGYRLPPDRHNQSANRPPGDGANETSPPPPPTDPRRYIDLFGRTPFLIARFSDLPCRVQLMNLLNPVTPLASALDDPKERLVGPPKLIHLAAAVAQQVLLTKIKAISAEYEAAGGSAELKGESIDKTVKVSPFQPASLTLTPIEEDKSVSSGAVVSKSPSRRVSRAGSQRMSPNPPTGVRPMQRTPSIAKRSRTFTLSDNPLFASPVVNLIAEESACKGDADESEEEALRAEQEEADECENKEDRIKLMMMQMLLSPQAPSTNQEEQPAASNPYAYHPSRSLKVASSQHHAVGTILELAEDPQALDAALAATVNHRLKHGVYAAATANTCEDRNSAGGNIPSGPPDTAAWDRDSSRRARLSMPGHPVVPMSPVPGPSHAIPASGSVPPSPSLYATPGHSNSMREKGHRRQPSAIKQKIADMAMVLAADTSSLLTLAPSLRSSFGRSLGGDLDFLAALGAPLSAVVDNETPGEASEVPPVINSPRKPVIMALGDYRDEDEDDGMCGVCLDDSGGGLIQLMPCHHLLCVECAEELVMLHTKDPCPCPFCRSLICNFASIATAARNMN